MDERETREYEQSRIDAAYSIGESLSQQLASPVQGATQKDAQDAHRKRQARRNQLDALLEDASQLLVRGRVDFADDEGAGEHRSETYYIGGVHLADEASDPVVVSWEAPLAKAFYEPTVFGNGRAVARRRTFDGRDRRLESIAEQTFVEGRPAPGSADPLLAALESRTSGELGQVIATIQAEQYALMERPLDKTLVIQGGPGTGKTIVGLHRISVLLYRSQGQLTEGDVLVVGPSDVFMRYVARVLPELGRTAVRQRAIDNVALHDVTVRGTDGAEARRIKGLPVMVDVIRAHLRGRITTPDEDLVFGPGASVPKEELAAILDEARTSSQPYNTRRDLVRNRLLEALGGAVAGRRPGAARELGMPIAREYATEFENALDRFIPTMSPREAVHELLTGPRLLAAAADGLLTPAEQAALRRRTDRLAEHPWSPDDLPLLDEAAHQLDGMSAMGQRYLHIVVDEAQDLSPMQLRMLDRRAAGAMTILGDLAQGMSPWAPQTWHDHLASGGIRPDEVAQLVTSYRTTQPLLEYANRLLSTIDVAVDPARSVLTTADEPAIMEFVDDDDLATQLVDVIESVQRQGVENNNVGIIGDQGLLDSVARWLASARLEHTWADRSLTGPVTLVPAEDAKGLEFDHVVVLEPERLYRSDPVMGPRLLFVAMTRARETLTLLHRDRLPAPLVSGTEMTPPAIADVTEPSAPTQPPSAPPLQVDSEEPTTPAYSHYVSHGGALYRLQVDGHEVAIERVPDATGPPHHIASGFVSRNDTQCAWSLMRADGAVIATTSVSGDGEAEDVLESVLSSDMRE